MNIKDLSAVFEKTFDPSVMDYTMTVVQGVKAHIEKIDSKISTASAHWKIDRMASVDRNILRIAVYEMIMAKETLEPKIVINEAIEIAKIFGTQESSAFVNGILDQILRNERV